MAPAMQLASRAAAGADGDGPDFPPIINSLSAPRSVYGPQMTILLDRRDKI
jgi:hypothetical protein